MNIQRTTLDKLIAGTSAKILGYAATNAADNTAVEQLRELGAVEGASICLRHRAPLGGDPLAVMVRGTLIGLRKDDAKLIEIEVLP